MILYIVVHYPNGLNGDVTRVISARKAKPEEEELYYEQFRTTTARRKHC
jgi:uncharacterized DUF497 family protein